MLFPQSYGITRIKTVDSNKTIYVMFSYMSYPCVNTFVKIQLVILEHKMDTFGRDPYILDL